MKTEKLDKYKILKEIFEDIESVAKNLKHSIPISALMKTEGGHTYSDGYYETLSPDFKSSGSSDLGL